jgi:hypothetical protein
MTHQNLLRLIGIYLNENGLTMDDFDADQFMIDMLRDDNIRISELQLAEVIEQYYLTH